jgi:hypothetical protein
VAINKTIADYLPTIWRGQYPNQEREQYFDIHINIVRKYCPRPKSDSEANPISRPEGAADAAAAEGRTVNRSPKNKESKIKKGEHKSWKKKKT